MIVQFRYGPLDGSDREMEEPLPPTLTFPVAASHDPVYLYEDAGSSGMEIAQFTYELVNDELRKAFGAPYYMPTEMVSRHRLRKLG